MYYHYIKISFDSPNIDLPGSSCHGARKNIGVAVGGKFEFKDIYNIHTGRPGPYPVLRLGANF